MEPIIGDLPEHIKKAREARLVLKRENEISHKKDIELLLKSENPEIQALCRVLRLDGQASR